MKNIGIWLDKEKAFIITIENGNETFTTIDSNVENFKIYGGSGTRFKGGPQDVVQDSRYLEREKHQLKAYFLEIINAIKDTSELVIFGPAETYLKFQKELIENHKSLNTKVTVVKKADSMTKNQTIALIKDAFMSK
ncbi:hypothetical protein BW723_03795 [Polaribacter reichenbachii]|uniref:Host attachment protein n=1 Tax=Polaribacter reichenbachii TaxID=996801 RepID=A0A1B8TVB0_9FLAO|nr:hypothetical protein [Polaribacter reichenbachii]APZ45473.1 hypothetical protein BW723_03795 [Polaribacter reichenbachii]AUC19334.1 hypothetical protein BTO17_11800 [Polaribacter reichenbachii]OBY63512.1 hypothetical protein LPB301_11910 [Polaribacter reichenbachii]